MPTKAEYDKLLNQYNIAIAKGQDLQEQLEKKQEQWQERDEYFYILEKLTRELCEGILAKDPDENKLGTDYAWSQKSVIELIQKSKKTFQSYTQHKLNELRHALAVAEDRLARIEGLEEQLDYMKLNPGTVQYSEEELTKKIENEKKEKELIKDLEKNTRDRVESGNIKIVISDNDDNEDVNALFDAIHDDNESIQITPKSIPTFHQKNAAKQRKEIRHKTKESPVYHSVDLNEYDDKLKESDWLVIQIIGEKGFSLYADIENEYLNNRPDDATCKIRTACTTLKSNGIIDLIKVTTPVGAITAHKLTVMGKRLYSLKFNEQAVLSEAEHLIAEHDNLNHGYGIKMTADVLEQKKEFKTVCSMNRENPIVVGHDSTYIPDIILTDKSDVKYYIEYEMGTHTQTDFNAKCNKMCVVTNVLNFVCPNKKVAEKIENQIQSWIKNRGTKNLVPYTIRVTTYHMLEHNDFHDNKKWKTVFKPGKKAEPYRN